MPRIRIVQTSDVHLRPERPERRRALELVFAQAVARAADAVVIAGDLFDFMSVVVPATPGQPARNADERRFGLGRSAEADARMSGGAAGSSSR